MELQSDSGLQMFFDGLSKLQMVYQMVYMIMINQS